jgi:signal transduction histidine kinase
VTEAALPAAGGSHRSELDTSAEQRSQVDQLRLFLTHWRGSLAAITLGSIAAAIAWGEQIPGPLRAVWCVMACINYVTQGVVCWRLERAPNLARALPSHLPWLLGTVVGSGVVWGLVPWMVATASYPVLMFAAMFNLILVFGVVNAPGTRSMVLCAVRPVMLLTITALFWHPPLLAAGLASAVLFGLILAYGLRVQSALQATMIERHAARDLAETLRSQQERLLELEGERTLLLERQRLMRDLHDGLGSALTSSLVAVQQGATSPEELTAMLGDCLDDLRTVIDSLEPIDCDLVALLAGIRFRLGPRLELAGIHLEWDMQDLPPLPWMGPPEALQLMRLVQEMLTNVVKHARATRVRVSTLAAPDQVAICVSDNGVGFTAATEKRGRGLRFLSQRAGLLGGQLRVESTPGIGTGIWLELPVERSAARRIDPGGG